jgi:DNA-binding transcriptional ArsR family regulator
MARPSRFSPRSEPYEALEERTVCREELCAALVRGVADAVRTGQARFDLVLGPRGAGKSHLLGLVEGRLRKELEGTAIVAGPPEEFHPSSLVHLLAEILRSLPSGPDAEPASRQLAILAAFPDDARDRAVAMIRARLQDLPLIIVIENLDVIFAAIGRDGQHQLRSILQTERRWSIVATSRSRTPAFSKESEPFYGTFIPRALEPLPAEGCREMLVRLARACDDEVLAQQLDTPKGLARVQTLRHVLGGHPRAMAFIFPHLHHDRPEAVEEALRDLAEELTPYFQEQMSRLPPGQRPVVELLAEHWTPLSVNEISNATFTLQPTTSTYLKRLREDAIVRSTKLGREHFYEISDPLFRIARAVKRDELRTKTFLRVLRSWYEFRGLDLWRLPMGKWPKVRAPSNLEISEYDSRLGSSLLQDLQEARYSVVVARTRTIDTDHSLPIAFRVVALSCGNDQEQAFSELATVHQTKIVDVISGIASIEMTLSRLWPQPLPASHHADRSLVGRLALALSSISAILLGEEGSLREAVEALEECLRDPSDVVRKVASEIILEFMVPWALVRAHELTLCGRLLAALQPTGTASMNAVLAGVALRAWAKGGLGEVFHQEPEKLYLLSQGFEAPAKLGLAISMKGAGLPAWVTADVQASLTAFACRIGFGWEQLDSGDQIWLAVVMVLILQDVDLFSSMPQFKDWLTTRAPASTALTAAAVHAGILLWIGVGQNLAPIMSAISLERELMASLGVDSTLVDTSDPATAYVRLAAPERAMVRQAAKIFEMNEWYTRLCELSSDEDA